MDPKDGIDRRQLKRIPFDREVEVVGIEKARAKLISLGGMFLDTSAEHSAGKILVLKFKLSDKDHEVITANARVVFSRSGIGTGFEFKDLTSETLEKLGIFMEGK